MISFPNSKINLGLNVLSKRQDGFHNIESIIYPVGWSDILEIIETNKDTFTITGITIPGKKEDNLVWQAYQSLKQNYNLPPLNIHLHKVIPFGAGLGGGSSDAAFMLKLLNEKFVLELKEKELESYAQQLGSDCAFFIKNNPVIVSKKGDHLNPVSLSLKDYFLVIIYPDIIVSTKEAYAGIKPEKKYYSIEYVINKPIHEWKEYLYNDFEISIFNKYPEIEDVKKKLYQNNALYAGMSGSGSAVYGIFSEPVKIQEQFPDHYKIWTETLK